MSQINSWPPVVILLTILLEQQQTKDGPGAEWVAIVLSADIEFSSENNF